MKPKFYSETEYWKRYLTFLPPKYQEAFEEPQETYWSWKDEQIHLDYAYHESNEVTVILLHGAGGNGRILSVLFSYLKQHGINYYAPDNLGYGLTKVSNKKFTYDDWVDMVSDFTRYIIQKDKKPVILIGMSIGGMLAYQVAAKVEAVKGLITTTLADPRDESTMVAMAKNRFLGTIGIKLGKAFSLVADHISLPIRWLCKINLMSRDPAFSALFMKDKHAGGINISMKFLRTFSSYNPQREFTEFKTCPMMLIHPEKDDWTPLALSKKIYDKLAVPKEFYLLKECGHAPIEKPGVFEMEAHILNFIKKRLAAKDGSALMCEPKHPQEKIKIMNEEVFWQIMRETNQESGGEPSIQQELIEKRLNDLSPDEIIEFDHIYQGLRHNAYDWKLWAAAYIVNGGCSDDRFSDFRAWLIGQGREVYTKALIDPDSLALLDQLEEDMDWEGYGYIAFTVYKRKTGKEMPIHQDLIHPAEPKGEAWEEDELETLLPQLSQKYS